MAGSAQASLFDAPAGAAPAPPPAASNRLAEPIDAVLAHAATRLGDWAPLIAAWAASAEGQALRRFIAGRQAAGATIYPADVFHALRLTPRAAVRVVILGQDPYHGPGQAEGLAFSVPAGQRIPPSLRNIDVELQRDLGLLPPAHGQLSCWARQGVLLLNTTLTVEDGQPASHARQGWEALTDALIRATAADAGDKAYLLWGAHAQAKRALIDAAGAGRHRVLCANHPSPLSARRPPVPFIGCGHFAAAQAFAAERHADLPRLDWRR
ncbi:uracil-DNA glycosylase [Aquabacterium sp. OR-4]|uniref:uracil-DNA glycosylase n=1 Tax=Aquabacterium sp. OR-4 TaxID=2978127 RepID=UPI0021B2F28F|nr:uracil-DNA glycosylase [Aquabacterium sp. OR-4]MDT7834152.1 uracil-DNA glycosylase [Aquabacterium sp. OR-4]